MESTATAITTPQRKFSNKRPDSMRVELLTIPENGQINNLQSVPSAVTVGFKDITYSVNEGILKRRKRILLDRINGEFAAGELTAIMGPSGSGKTSLMNILAGYTTSRVTGQKLVNDEIMNENLFRKKSCYIMQDDNVQPLLTVHEAMKIAADLKMESTYTAKDKKSRVKDILESMNLWQQRKTLTRLLSGGQKKRLSIALELLKNPQVMFFDEPTSGLDSLSSKQCVLVLKELAMTGRSIICTIHQPSATIFEMFDHLYLLASGRCLYQGSVKGLLPFLADVNLKCPEYHNPADYILEVASGEHGDYTDILSMKSENGLSQEWRKKPMDSTDMQSFERIERMMENGQITPVRPSPIFYPKVRSCDKPKDLSRRCCRNQSYPTSFCNQISVLIKRTFIILTRDRTLTYSRILTHTVIAIFIGILYYGIGIEASNMWNNFNFLFFTVMFLMMTAFNCVTTTFPSELPIITREHFNKWYSLKSYYIAISVADIPVQMIATLIYALVTYFMTKQPIEMYRIGLFIFMCMLISLVAQSFGLLIGACMDVKNGVVFGPFCLLPFTIFSGFFVQLNSSHPYLRWIFHTSFLKYGFEGLVLAVLGYNRAKLPCDADYCHYVHPEKFLDQMDMRYAKYSTAVIVLIGLFLGLRIAAYYALSIQIRYNRQKR